MNQKTAKQGPLSGIKILDLGTFLAAPWAVGILADQGAEVIKVEVPGIGDIVRYFGGERNGVGGLFHSINRGKESIAINMKNPAGLEIVHKLAADSDVVLHNFRPGVSDRLGINYKELKKNNPELIYIAVNGFGETGPYAGKRAYDAVVQAFAGVALSQMSKEGEPYPSFQIMADKLTAITASQAITAALLARERGQGGQDIKLSMTDACIQFMWIDSQETHAFLEPGAINKPMPMQTGVTPIKFKNGWGQAQPVSDAEFIGYCKAFSVDISEDERVNNIAGRAKNWERTREVYAEVEKRAAATDVDEAMAAMNAEDVPCIKAEKLRDLPQHPQCQAVEMFIESEHPIAGKIQEPRSAAIFGGTPVSNPTPSSSLGQHTDKIMRSLGYSEEEITALKGKGVLE